MSRSLYDHSANDRGERHDWAEHAEDTARHSSSFEGAFGMEERSGDVSSDSRTTWGDRLALHLRGNLVALETGQERSVLHRRAQTNSMACGWSFGECKAMSALGNRWVVGVHLVTTSPVPARGAYARHRSPGPARPPSVAPSNAAACSDRLPRPSSRAALPVRRLSTSTRS